MLYDWTSTAALGVVRDIQPKEPLTLTGEGLWVCLISSGRCTASLTDVSPSPAGSALILPPQSAAAGHLVLSRAPLTLTPEGESHLLCIQLTGQAAGSFVSLHIGGRLRGCIGTIGPTQENLAWEIIRNAVSAGTRDPRFPAVRAEELDELEYSVDVLGQPESVDALNQLDPRQYGVIVSFGHQRGLLLPDLDGVDTVEQQIDIARQKGGIRATDPYTLQRFKVVRHL